MGTKQDGETFGRRQVSGWPGAWTCRWTFSARKSDGTVVA